MLEWRVNVVWKTSSRHPVSASDNRSVATSCIVTHMKQQPRYDALAVVCTSDLFAVSVAADHTQREVNTATDALSNRYIPAMCA